MKGFKVYNLLFEILFNIGICFYNSNKEELLKTYSTATENMYTVW